MTTTTQIAPVCDSEARSATIDEKTGSAAFDYIRAHTEAYNAKRAAYEASRRPVTLICTSHYGHAVEIAETVTASGWPDEWYWFASFWVAKDWLERCEARGVPFKPRWLIRDASQQRLHML
jgi:hypothetical protein